MGSPNVLPFLDTEETAAPRTCELCGQTLTGAPDRRGDRTLAADMLRRIALLTDQYPMQMVLLLRRLVQPGASYRALAKGTHFTPMALSKQAHAIGKNVPELQSLLGLLRPQCARQRERRLREALAIRPKPFSFA